VSAQLHKKKPPITVDGNGGSFSPSAGHSELTHALVSGNDWAADATLGENMAQRRAWRYPSHSLVYPQQK